MPSLGIVELVVILVIALIIFGPGKLPDVGRSVGKALREFKTAKDSVVNAVTVSEIKEDNKENVTSA
ncbi:twin-arginine translocase TatA/TatE family subunit [Desulfosporosinus sp. BICA1-9]|uniref:twin-arginine translocase TatA/TatE family subunit n=1 Tax=Desulfosporosinus sp. BICA1-9 TaxID=1531958 RepID=UPI00054C54E4|nr:twin-arginine translocase TatA/TatE family subunit [Desulfosporosinus sp. BICA1-9]KJS49632.1 MAG: hypothetical protein VR66_07470 [Peptococcaceae bacterium BRH_c23]KJS84185.1 MAG: hypothetical protein JL57_21200 [Desulfosporosinus sp. BICA1-9]